ncbi:MAG: hypothetical protein ACRDRW_12775 [Pseudonocardiaceae bacterium]
MRYEVIFASYAEELRESLPPGAKRALAGKVRCLAQDPTEDATYSSKTDRWTSHFGDWGVIEYTVHSAVVRVVVLRVAWTDS